VEQERRDVVNELPATGTATSWPVDAEHGGLRVSVFGIFILAWIVGYFIISLIIPGTGVNIIAVGGGFVIGYAASFVLERLLRKSWPSGRHLDADARGVKLMRKATVEQEVRTNEDPVSVLMWRFETPRRSRVPKGWYVLGFAFEQDEKLLCLYTFMSPKDFKAFDMGERFTALKSRKKEGRNKSGGRDDLMMAGEQRRLYQAENQRWQDGAELTQPDFKSFLETVKQNYPEWMH
jgi:hypothetical protein